jgi:type II secretory pathway pseudopilin PulG
MKLPLTIVNRKSSTVSAGGFTMIEIALCLAIIGFALVSILLVLPSGMNTQRDTREETIIGQDASELMEAIKSGERGNDDLTNYVYQIVNSWTSYNANGTINTVGMSTNSYVWASVNIPPNATGADIPSMHLTNGLRIIGLLSTPEYTTSLNGSALSTTFGQAYTSNHVVAYVHSFSGLAAEKPPQNNQIMQEDTFTYRVLCVNAPMPMDTNLFQPVWQSQSYSTGAQVFYNIDFWRATANTLASDIPGQSSKWVQVPNYALELLNAQRELRLLFSWPQEPNGNVGGFRQTFRSTVAGQLIVTNYFNYFPGINPLYFYESQSFTNAP